MSVAILHDRAIWDAFVETSPDTMLFFALGLFKNY